MEAQAEYFKVFVKMSSGVRGYTGWQGLSRDKAESIAAVERAKSGVTDVEIRPCTQWGDPI